ncbi:MAG: hypothetical protein FJY67_02240 [Calditrichaeota bacterium]|nr:hypothetical protein [Calditrichota bacterium]
MESWIAFGRGPLFRLSFGLMLLGLARIIFLAAMRQNGAASPQGLWSGRDRWMASLKNPFTAVILLIFHVSLILVPLFLPAHVIQWKQNVGFAWLPISQRLSDMLTIALIATAIALLAIRVGRIIVGQLRPSKGLIWPIFLIIPFISGFICVNLDVTPNVYYGSLLIHVYSGNLVMLALPFTRMAACILEPLAVATVALSPVPALRRWFLKTGLAAEDI